MFLVPKGAFPVQGNNSNLITWIHLKEWIIDQEGLIQRIMLLIGTRILLPNTVPLSSLCDLSLNPSFSFITSALVEGEWETGVCRVVVHLSLDTSMRIYVQASVNCHNIKQLAKCWLRPLVLMVDSRHCLCPCFNLTSMWLLHLCYNKTYYSILYY